VAVLSVEDGMPEPVETLAAVLAVLAAVWLLLAAADRNAAADTPL